MRYEGNLYRPPSEAHSLIVQATIGCSHNKCTFCSMYKNEKFRIRKPEEIKEDLKNASNYYREVRRIFLADGDALIMKTSALAEILDYCYKIFPQLERVGTCASTKSVMIKSIEELKLLREKGLKIAYLGIESGSDKVLANVNKGVTAAEIVASCNKLMEAGITLSVMILLGLGGIENSKSHIEGTIEVLNKINPDYLSFLTLIIDKDAPLYDDIVEGRFTPNSPIENLIEIRDIIKGTDLDNCIVRSNHASNYLAVKGVLDEDKDHIVKSIDDFLNRGDDLESILEYKNQFRRF